MTTPPCTRYSPALFDSPDLADHLKARAICAGCPMVTACLQRAVAIAAEAPATTEHSRGPDGTWGGLLWKDGHVVDPAHAGMRRAAA